MANQVRSCKLENCIIATSIDQDCQLDCFERFEAARSKHDPKLTEINLDTFDNCKFIPTITTKCCKSLFMCSVTDSYGIVDLFIDTDYYYIYHVPSSRFLNIYLKAGFLYNGITFWYLINPTNLEIQISHAVVSKTLTILESTQLRTKLIECLKNKYKLNNKEIISLLGKSGCDIYARDKSEEMSSQVFKFYKSLLTYAYDCISCRPFVDSLNSMFKSPEFIQHIKEIELECSKDIIQFIDIDYIVKSYASNILSDMYKFQEELALISVPIFIRNGEDFFSKERASNIINYILRLYSPRFKSL